ncbi:MAG: MBL fold metallo-hydrolase [Clostridiales bacterium]|nr:MBL fold metallo-hydrolase [Clostridiales bacterium]
MKLYHLRSGPLNVNTYFLVNEDTKEAVIVDGGENYKRVKQVEEQLGVKIKAVLLTHAHFDHAGNAKKLQDDGAKIYIGKLDAHKLLDGGNLAHHFGRKFDYLTADKTLVDGEEFTECGINFKAFETPGHTDGSLTYLTENMLFTGDTLFLECVGRTDFPTGDKDTLVRSVKKLFELDGEYTVYPGHDEFTTLSHERKFNLFVDYD